MSLNIRTKLLSGPIILATLILLLGLIGAISTREQVSQFEEYGEIVPYIVKLQDLKYSQQRLISGLNRLFNPYNSNEDFNNIFKELAESEKNYTWALRVIDKFPKSIEEQELYNVFLKSNESFYLVINKVIPNAKGRLKAGLRLDKVLDEINSQIKKEGTGLIYQKTQNNLNKLLDYSTAYYSVDILKSYIGKSNKIMFLFLFFAIIFFIGALVFAFFVANKITNLYTKQEKMSLNLSKYLSPQVYNSIVLGKEVKIGTNRKNLTVFFSDIQGFTQLTDVVDPEILSTLLNDYFNKMSTIALKYGGTIDKFMGDAIMIFFGDPDTNGMKRDALNCILMSLEMRKCMKKLKLKWKSEGILNPLKIRTGISSGFCTVGNFGSEDRLDYTIIGRNVNLASRLESIAEADEILISHQTYTMIKDYVYCERREKIHVKGIANPIQTYRVVDLHKKMDNKNLVIQKELTELLDKIHPSELSDYERVTIAKLLNDKEKNTLVI